MAKNSLQVVYSMKAVNAWDLDTDTGWTVLSGDEQRIQGVDLYYRRVPWLKRAVDDRANLVAGMPFKITDGDKEYDSSTQYENKLEFLPNPSRLFSQLEHSLAMHNRAYVMLATNPAGFVKEVKYLRPNSIKEIYHDKTGEIIGYERMVKGTPVPVSLNNIIALYKCDHTNEVGPSENSDAESALISAGVLYSVDKFVGGYFERGAIKATILTMDGPAPEADRLQIWWRDVIAGVKNAWSAVVLRAQKAMPVVIGEGLEALTNETLTQERRQDIATAIGVPESRLWSAAANYATAEQDMKSYYSGTIIPECNLIAEAFNDQLFTAKHRLEGYTLQFLSETLEVFQKDANEQAQASKSFIDFLNACPTAEIALAVARVNGVEIDQELEAAIEAMFEEKEKNKEMLQQQMAQAQAQPPAESSQSSQNEPDEEPEPEQEEKPNPFEARSALAQWKKKAVRSVEQGKGANVEFTTSVIPAQLCEAIRYELEVCKTIEEVKAAFDSVSLDTDAADQLKRANDLMERILAVA